MKYPKIETLYNRDPETFKVIPGELRLPEFGLINRWLITEKIDGTNIRVILDTDGSVEIRGRTDKAQFNPVVLKTLQDMFPVHRVRAAIECNDDATWPYTVFYGEGYGEKIQSGGVYRKGQSFRLFDVRVGDWWLNWDSVCNIAEVLSIRTVPVLTTLTVPVIEWDGDLSRFLQASEVAWQDSQYSDAKAEGVVARTDPLLFTRRGNRVLWKLKFKDFA